MMCKRVSALDLNTSQLVVSQNMPSEFQYVQDVQSKIHSFKSSVELDFFFIPNHHNLHLYFAHCWRTYFGATMQPSLLQASSEFVLFDASGHYLTQATCRRDYT